MAKKEKATRLSKEKKQRNYSPWFLLFSIRNKIAFAFLIPIGFMIVIGLTAYEKAVEGMSDNFRDSTQETISMATKYLDMSGTFIESEAMKYAFASDLSKYFLGMYESDSLGKLNVLTNIKSDVMSSQTSNPFISNIHIVTKSGINMISTKSSNTLDGFWDEYRETVSTGKKSVEPWIDSHPMIDEKVGTAESDYILAYETTSQSSNAGIVIDVKANTIRDFLAGLDLGEGSIVGFVTENGREIICENPGEGQESIQTEGKKLFYGQDFYAVASASEDEEQELNGTSTITYGETEYLFIYSRSTKTKATVCALVPMSIVTSQAQDIKDLTIQIVILACVVVLLFAVFLAAGIQNNMKRISRKLGEVAKGDLTVQVKAKGRDEFRGLADSANNMIENTKKLVNKVSAATGQLESSARNVEEASGVINEYSLNITNAIEEINEGMTQQSRHAQECVDKTDILSREIQGIGHVVERVENLVDETEEMILKGIEIVQLLGDRAQETTNITREVGESIEKLKKESETINKFVAAITDITEQTNLLSLNASIEAARAGEAGRGFAVVAEEIRKLADDSAKAAGEIKNNVGHITAQTQNSVESANQAQTMVASQTEAVEQVVTVFQNMQNRMTELISGLKDIVNGIEKADKERDSAVEAVKNISGIIDETAGSAETVNDVAVKLLQNVEHLNETAEALGQNMEGLKNEIAVFKV